MKKKIFKDIKEAKSFIQRNQAGINKIDVIARYNWGDVVDGYDGEIKVENKKIYLIKNRATGGNEIYDLTEKYNELKEKHPDKFVHIIVELNEKGVIEEAKRFIEECLKSPADIVIYYIRDLNLRDEFKLTLEDVLKISETGELKIPARLAGIIIGKGGRRIKQIEYLIGRKVKVIEALPRFRGEGRLKWFFNEKFFTCYKIAKTGRVEKDPSR